MSLSLLSSMLGLAGAGLLMAGVWVERPRSRAGWLLAVGSLLLMVGAVASVVRDVWEPHRAHYPAMALYSVVLTIAYYCFVGGLLVGGPAFLWLRLQEKRAAARGAIEAEVNRVMAEQQAAAGTGQG